MDSLTGQPQVVSSWRCFEMGMPQERWADSGLLCFPCREYTEDGQVKTERRYSYSEYGPPILKGHAPGLWVDAGHILAVGKGTEPGIGVPKCWSAEPCSPVHPARLQELPLQPWSGHAWIRGRGASRPWTWDHSYHGH